MAELCAKLGQIHVTLASNPAAPVTNRRDAWREALTWYERSMTTWKNLRSRGSTGKTDAEKLERVENEIKKCTTEMARL